MFVHICVSSANQKKGMIMVQLMNNNAVIKMTKLAQPTKSDDVMGDSKRLAAVACAGSA
jgi:hypothetical protein